MDDDRVLQVKKWPYAALTSDTGRPLARKHSRRLRDDDDPESSDPTVAPDPAFAAAEVRFMLAGNDSVRIDTALVATASV